MQQLKHYVKLVPRFIHGVSQTAFEKTSHVAMFHPGRCGSTVLGGLLGQHPDIFWGGEIYHRTNDEIYIQEHFPMFKLFWRMMTSAKKHYGYEVKYLHKGQQQLIGLDWPIYVQRLWQMGCKHFIFLGRKNSLRNLVSIAVSLARNKWHQTPSEIEELTKVKIDVEGVLTTNGYMTLLEYLDRYQDAQYEIKHVLKRYGYLQLYYEDDIAIDPILGYQRVCQYLGVAEYNQVSIQYARTNPFLIKDIVSNFDEVSRMLSGTSFEWMLNA